MNVPLHTMRAQAGAHLADRRPQHAAPSLQQVALYDAHSVGGGGLRRQVDAHGRKGALARARFPLCSQTTQHCSQHTALQPAYKSRRHVRCSACFLVQNCQARQRLTVFGRVNVKLGKCIGH